ncbi:hypothetical protein IGL98_003349 [Enterococcus sp. DIV0840]|uniref:AMP-binding protein n=1 Tax=unclassified Enterococcus TaxID=2608891 RepID=UPI001A8E2713|nr:AMP-binding protein [Enterococcus sp. DIV0849a]MBO0433096.1 AMP-binding protein [Enterococcus sp. DIV0849a]
MRYSNMFKMLGVSFKRFGENIAITDGITSLTYSQLKRKSDRYSAFLINEGISKNEVVGIQMERSIEAIAAMIGVISSGATYTVINPDYPRNRKELLMSELNIKIVLDAFCILPEEYNDLIYQDKIRSANTLSYIAFTSGTTGIPKAVGISDKAILRLIKEPRLSFEEGKIMSHISPLEFDASLIEIWCPLLKGMTISILSKKEVLNIFKVEERIRQGINIMWITSSLFNFWIDKNPELLVNVDCVIVGGEQLSLEHVQIALNYTTVINGYGPTEGTVFTTLDVIGKLTNINEISIETPVYGTSVYIIGENGKEAQQGELYIAGDGLSIGYINSKAETKKKFIYWNDQKVYKTGDMVKKKKNGKIIYLGRIDRTVKIKGFRVDLGEIEYNVNRLNKVNCHAFVYKKKIIVVVSKNAKEVKQTLIDNLPEFMRPSQIIELSTFPLKKNGKVDTQLLEEKSIGLLDCQ